MKKILVLLALSTALMLGLFAQAPAPAGDTVDVTFTYTPSRREAQTVTEVTLAGSFNNWDGFATPLTKGNDGVWSAKVPLKKGVTQWKFLVNGNWIQNMETVADKISPKPDSFPKDPYGGKNCENNF